MLSAKEAMKTNIEKIIRREFSVEIRKKEEEILLINQVFRRVNSSNVIIQQHPFYGLFSRTTGVSQYQKGRTVLDFNEARDNGWQ